MSEHQPTSWASFFFDLHVVVPFAPVGIYFLFQRLHDNGDAKIFLIIYGTIAWYFAGKLAVSCKLLHVNALCDRPPWVVHWFGGGGGFSRGRCFCMAAEGSRAVHWC